MVCTRNNVCICFALCKFNCRQGYLGTLPVLAGSVWLIWWRSIRGQQLLQAGKILWNLHSFFLERVWEWKTMESVCRMRAGNPFCYLPRGRASLQNLSAAFEIWYPSNWRRLKTSKRLRATMCRILKRVSRCWAAKKVWCTIIVANWLGHLARVEVFLVQMLIRGVFRPHLVCGSLESALPRCLMRPCRGMCKAWQALGNLCGFRNRGRLSGIWTTIMSTII